MAERRAGITSAFATVVLLTCRVCSCARGQMGVGLDLFGGLVYVTSFEKDKFPTENFPEIKGSHREISTGKYTIERKERSSWAKRRREAAHEELQTHGL